MNNGLFTISPSKKKKIKLIVGQYAFVCCLCNRMEGDIHIQNGARDQNDISRNQTKIRIKERSG